MLWNETTLNSELIFNNAPVIELKQPVRISFLNWLKVQHNNKKTPQAATTFTSSFFFFFSPNYPHGPL